MPVSRPISTLVMPRLALASPHLRLNLELLREDFETRSGQAGGKGERVPVRSAVLLLFVPGSAGDSDQRFLPTASSRPCLHFVSGPPWGLGLGRRGRGSLW